MKRIITFSLLLLIAQSIFAQEVKITGKLIKYQATDNDSITLQINSSPQNPIILKSAISKKGEFSFKYTEISTNYCELYLTPNDKAPLFLSSGDNVTISAEANSMSQTTSVKGSMQTEAFLKNIRTITSYQTEIENQRKIFEYKSDSIEKAKQHAIEKSIRQNPYMLSNLGVLSVLPLEKYSEIYQMVDTALMSVYPGNAFVIDFHESLQKTMVLREGAEITNIVLSDVNGTQISLESLRGKVVLVDFWASWCRPCRMEIPNFKRMYDAYHQAGFEIYSVSVDNDVMAWKRALEQEKMPWPNVRDDKKVYSTMFNVASIPFTILIDKEGKIVAKGLRGPDLSDAINKTLSK